MEVAEVGAPLAAGYIGCCLAIGFHSGVTPYLVLRSDAFILRVDIAFAIHAWFIHGVTQIWWCPSFHGQGEYMVSPIPKVYMVLFLTLLLPPLSSFSSRGNSSIPCAMCPLSLIISDSSALSLLFKCPWLGSYPIKTCRCFAVL